MNDKQSVEDHEWMSKALECAKLAASRGEVPVGAALTHNSELISARGNSPISLNDPTAHAEILTIRDGAIKLSNYRLTGTTLYVTLEPCIMCMGAIIHSRISRLVYGATDPKTGAVRSVYDIGSDGRLNHSLEAVGGIMEQECSRVLKEFFRLKRSLAK